MSLESAEALSRRPNVLVLVLIVVAGGLAVAALSWFVGFGDDIGDQPTSAPATTTTMLTTTTMPIATTASGATQTPTTTVEFPEGGYVRPFLWRGGDCVNGDVRAGQDAEVWRADCDLAHDFEVYREALVDSRITAFDEQAIWAYADEVCRQSLGAYVPTYETQGLSYLFFAPTEETWNNPEEPDRVVTCLLFSNEAPLIGRAG